MRVLIVLNENPPGSHPDTYETFTGLVRDGFIEWYDVYSHLLAKGRGLTDKQIAREIFESVADNRQDLVIWMHTGRLKIGDATLQRIRRLPQRPVMAYWEGDAYHPWFKPVPREMLGIMRHCDRVFMCSGGSIMKTLARAGITEARFAPHCTSGTRFRASWRPEGPFDHDVVLIGNRVTTKRPFKTMPGARERQRLVHLFEQRFGSNFAVYGSGWTGPSARGFRPFHEQEQLNATSRVAIGVENLFNPFYFSDRLPIALACGVPLIYRRNPGHDQVFGDALADRFFCTPPEAIALVERLLASDSEALRAESQANRLFFEQNLTTEIVARYVVSESVAHTATASAECTLSERAGAATTKPPWQQIPPLITGGRIYE